MRAGKAQCAPWYPLVWYVSSLWAWGWEGFPDR